MAKDGCDIAVNRTLSAKICIFSRHTISLSEVTSIYHCDMMEHNFCGIFPLPC